MPGIRIAVITSGKNGELLGAVNLDAVMPTGLRPRQSLFSLDPICILLPRLQELNYGS